MRTVLVHPHTLMYSGLSLRLEPLGIERVATAVRTAGHPVAMVDLQASSPGAMERLRALPAPTRWASASIATQTCPTSSAWRRRSRLAVLTVWSSPAATAADSSPSACSTRRMRRSMGSLAARVSSPLQQCWPVRTTTPLEAPGAVTLDGARSAAQGSRASRRCVASARLSHRRRHDSSASLTRRRRSRTRGAVCETARSAAPGPCLGAAAAG